jgi:hypothetical protein
MCRFSRELPLIEFTFCSQTPVLNDVRDITLARNGLLALISYENKVRSIDTANDSRYSPCK